MSKKEKPKLKKLRKGQEEGKFVFDKDSLFVERKKALMNRDPVVTAYLEELFSYNFKKDKLGKQSEGLEKQRQELESKWNVNILNKVSNLPSSPIKSFEQKELNRFAPDELVISNRTKGYPVSSLTPYNLLSKDWLEDVDDVVNIQVDLRLINKSFNSEKLVKDATWEIVKKYLKGKKKDIPREPQELKFLYRIRSQDKFNNYVRWYDLHTQEKLGFRPIAAWENTQKTNPKRGKLVLQQLIYHKVKCHGHIPGEDKVEKAIKLIYEAIQRKKYSAKAIEPVVEEYNCRHHGVGCPTSCTYYQEWLGKFDRLYPT